MEELDSHKEENREEVLHFMRVLNAFKSYR